jgi:hypothetical protein
MAGSGGGSLEHNPEKWVPVFPRDKRSAFARRSCSSKKIERDDDSKKVITPSASMLRLNVAAACLDTDK